MIIVSLHTDGDTRAVNCAVAHHTWSEEPLNSAVEAWLLQRSPSRENYLFVCSCIKCVSQTDELDVTSEEEEDDEGEAEGETEGDEAEDEMTDVWWKTFPLPLFPFPTPHCKQQPKPRRINNRARCGKTLSVCFTGRWFWFRDRRTSGEVRGCGFCTRQQINGRTT